jgi:hypothetical protein
MSTLARLKDSLGIDSQISRLISNTDPGIDSITEVYQALYELHQTSLAALEELEQQMLSISGPQGISGVDGSQGPEGPQGNVGPNGTNGIDGVQGPEGPQGFNGSEGFQGPQGSVGLIGPQGPQGNVGVNGINGVQGFQGPPAVNSSVAFSPQDIADCDTAPTAATTQYYYQTISTVKGTISKAKLWGYSGSDTVLFGLYRGTLSGSMTLIGQGSSVCGIGPNVITLTATSGQTLDVEPGEDLVVGYYPNGTSWRTIYDVGISDLNFGITNTNNITTMPATPIGTATAVRFALTLY